MERVVVVTGGRVCEFPSLVEAALDRVSPVAVCVGDAPGVDAVAREWAKRKGVQLRVFDAPWGPYSDKAGPLRNEKMLAAAGTDALVLAFNGGAGTSRCIESARRRGMQVQRVLSEADLDGVASA